MPIQGRGRFFRHEGETRVVLYGLAALAALMVLATLLPLLRVDAWWIRIFDFPRLQIAALLLLSIVGALFVMARAPATPPWQRWALVVPLAALLYQTWCMARYTPLRRLQVQGSSGPRADRCVSLMMANVLMSNRRADGLLRLVEEFDPDVVLAVECDHWWQGALGSLQARYPFTVLVPLPNTYGMLLYSRLELRDVQVHYLIEQDVPSIHATLRLRSGDTVELRCLHPKPPAPGENWRSTERDAELLIVGRALKELDQPAIVAGDLNDVAWSRTNDLFARISGLLDPRLGRGFFPTFNAKWPLIRFPLDHCFHSRHFRLVDFERLPAWGSDHFPVYVKLSYEPDAEREQQADTADGDDHAEAAEKVADAGVTAAAAAPPSTAR